MTVCRKILCVALFVFGGILGVQATEVYFWRIVSGQTGQVVSVDADGNLLWSNSSPGQLEIIERSTSLDPESWTHYTAVLSTSTVSSALAFDVKNPEYLVVDLSGGPLATNYPISDLDAVPPGGWSEEHRTTKLVLRRIPAGTFSMGSPTNEVGRFPNESQHEVTISQSFYMGVFEVTQKQWERVMGGWPSYFTNTIYRASRPVEQVSYNMIRGSTEGAGWPGSSVVDADSFMGRLRARTGKVFDLPTGAQWEYTGRAGTTTALNSGQNLTNTTADASLDLVGRYWYNGGSSYSPGGDDTVGTATVGRYQGNAWGLYDIHGNVREWCLDWVGTYPIGPLTDPVGVPSGSARMLRGGGWSDGANVCRVASRFGSTPDGGLNDSLGFRVALPQSEE